MRLWWLFNSSHSLFREFNQLCRSWQMSVWIQSLVSRWSICSLYPSAILPSLAKPIPSHPICHLSCFLSSTTPDNLSTSPILSTSTTSTILSHTILIMPVCVHIYISYCTHSPLFCGDYTSYIPTLQFNVSCLNSPLALEWWLVQHTYSRHNNTNKSFIILFPLPSCQPARIFFSQ